MKGKTEQSNIATIANEKNLNDVTKHILSNSNLIEAQTNIVKTKPYNKYLATNNMQPWVWKKLWGDLHEVYVSEARKQKYDRSVLHPKATIAHLLTDVFSSIPQTAIYQVMNGSNHDSFGDILSKLTEQKVSNYALMQSSKLKGHISTDTLDLDDSGNQVGNKERDVFKKELAKWFNKNKKNLPAGSVLSKNGLDIVDQTGASVKQALRAEDYVNMSMPSNTPKTRSIFDRYPIVSTVLSAGAILYSTLTLAQYSAADYFGSEQDKHTVYVQAPVQNNVKPKEVIKEVVKVEKVYVKTPVVQRDPALETKVVELQTLLNRKQDELYRSKAEGTKMSTQYQRENDDLRKRLNAASNDLELAQNANQNYNNALADHMNNLKRNQSLSEAEKRALEAEKKRLEAEKRRLASTLDQTIADLNQTRKMSAEEIERLRKLANKKPEIVYLKDSRQSKETTYPAIELLSINRNKENYELYCYAGRVLTMRIRSMWDMFKEVPSSVPGDSKDVSAIEQIRTSTFEGVLLKSTNFDKEITLPIASMYLFSKDLIREGDEFINLDMLSQVEKDRYIAVRNALNDLWTPKSKQLAVAGLKGKVNSQYIKIYSEKDPRYDSVEELSKSQRAELATDDLSLYNTKISRVRVSDEMARIKRDLLSNFRYYRSK